ncbi:MAG: bifunctional diaminohydroxyphosphoribosylaminopyrimidine deaminase/5-amino-6-(5-phosphoribosylamino)uracil reductase RibD [Candidatus Micrarchaeota archaeon]|nr:bifunctional diaminohydroxyphosphoribosylaminopyrimidine deaminase/5-amino-6-(5-phosphoribosylamino)uracil reductase RibD [Candidatus Micrarchaeota archaeon]
MAFSKQDERFMRLCLKLAKKGEGKVSPNPLVGAVLVRKGRIIGKGFHASFFGPHAEAEALSKKDARGATLYISLEPCVWYEGKRNPPCAALAARCGVSRVVIASKDPNPRVSGKGIAYLRSSGVKVDVGLLCEEAQELNECFFKFAKTGEPFVAAKLAQSADGFIGVKGRSRIWLSGRQFDYHSHALRNRHDAILVGINTVLADNPRLTCRKKGGRNPARIIIDSRLRIPLGAKALENAGKEKVIIATTSLRSLEKQKQLEKLGAEVLVCGKRKVELRRLLRRLPEHQIYSVLIEGGAKVLRSALKEKCIDKLIVAISGKKIGSKQAIRSPFALPFLKKRLRRLKVEKMGSDTVYCGYLRLP